jgi:hypothetical protein
LDFYGKRYTGGNFPGNKFPGYNFGHAYGIQATSGRPFPRNKFWGYHTGHAYGIWIFTGSVLLAGFSPRINSRVTMLAMPTAFHATPERPLPRNKFPAYHVGHAHGIWILPLNGLVTN